jgi:hypothetical protein
MPQHTTGAPTKDNWLDEHDVTANHDGASLTENRQNDGDMRDIIMQFDYSAIPPGSQITTVVLWMYQTDGPPNAPGNITRVLEANSGWSETASCWKRHTEPGTEWAGGQNGCHIVGTDIAAINMATWFNWPTTANSWVSQECDAIDFQNMIDEYNAGFKIYYAQRGLLSVARSDVFHSRTGTNKPYMVIDYSLPSIRLTRYHLNVWDAKSKIKDAEGRIVPPDEIEANEWLRLIGAGRPTTKAYDTLVEDPTVCYIENVSYRMEPNSAKIRGSKESILQSFLKRLGGVSS